MGTMFEIPGWDEFVARCEGVVDKWEDKKNRCISDTL